MKILISWSHKTPSITVAQNLGISHAAIKKLITKFISLQESFDFRTNKAGGPGKIVQVDETMLNYKCKSHRGRSSRNKSDALCIVEYDGHITRGFTVLISNKKEDKIIPILCNNIVNGSTIWADEHKIYSSLTKNGYFHQNVCHKYNFINKVNGCNAQAVEAFNNELKLEIKRRKGVLTSSRGDFLKEFTWLFNNKKDGFKRILKMIKI